MSRRAEDLSAEGLLSDVAGGAEILERARAIRESRPDENPGQYAAYFFEMTPARERELRRIEDSERIGHSSQNSRGGPSIDPSRRELEVLELVSEGFYNDEIADRLIIGEETVKSHLRHVYAKLYARNRAHAVALAIGRGLIEPPTERDA